MTLLNTLTDSHDGYPYKFNIATDDREELIGESDKLVEQYIDLPPEHEIIPATKVTYKTLLDTMIHWDLVSIFRDWPDMWFAIDIKHTTDSDNQAIDIPIARSLNPYPLAKLLNKALEGTVKHIENGSVKGIFIIWDGTRWVTEEKADGLISRIVSEFTTAMNQLFRYIHEQAKEDKEKDPCIRKINNVPIPLTFYLGTIAQKIPGNKDKILTELRGCTTLTTQDKDNQAKKYLMAFKNGITCDFSYRSLQNFFFKNIPFWRYSSPEDNIDQVAGCDFDPTADTVKWRKFLMDVLSDDSETFNYMQMVLGKSLIESADDAELYLFYGAKGRNGKSVLTNVIQEVLGTYSYAISPQSLSTITEYTNSPNPDLAQCADKRYISCSENSENERLSSQVIKSLTGRTRITARRLYSNDPSFRIEGILVIDTNYKPAINDNKIFTTQRMVVIPFNRCFKPEEQNTDLTEELNQELPGIVNFLIQGLWKYYQFKIDEHHSFKEARSQAVIDTTTKYQNEEDQMQQFIAYSLEKINWLGSTGPNVTETRNEELKKEYFRQYGNYVLVTDLYYQYTFWASKIMGLKNYKDRKRFMRDLEDHGITIKDRERVQDVNNQTVQKRSVILGYKICDEARIAMQDYN